MRSPLIYLWLALGCLWAAWLLRSLRGFERERRAPRCARRLGTGSVLGARMERRR
jgi:hypothetical protein